MSIVEPRQLTDEALSAEVEASRPLVDDLAQKDAKRRRLPKGDERAALWHEVRSRSNRNLLRRFGALTEECERRIRVAEYKAEKPAVAAFLVDYAMVCKKHGMFVRIWEYDYWCIQYAEAAEIDEMCDDLNDWGIDCKQQAFEE